MVAAQQSPIFPTLHLLEVVLRYGDISNKLNLLEQAGVVTYMMSFTTRVTSLLEEPITDESPEGLLLLGSLDSAGPCGPQLLMSMTWRVMQSLCSSLVLVLGDQKTPSIATKYVEEEIGLYLRDLLMRVRHHGVFENVHSAFISYCQTMWVRDKDMIVAWLDDVMRSVEKCKDDMTYTRRSAGIPCLIQALVVSEPARNGKPYLRDTLLRLLNLAENSPELTPKIHSLNILQVLFKDSKLSEFIIPYVGRGFEMAIKGFSNKTWSLRNSSTLLFSALMSRMFNMKQKHVRRTTASTFFTLYPNLHPFFLEELIQNNQGSRLYHPSLYPILLILQQLQPCPVLDETKLSLNTFVPLITHLGHSGVMKTRSLASETLSLIIPLSELNNTILNTVTSLEPTDKQNTIHGKLLQILHMIEVASKEQDREEEKEEKERSRDKEVEEKEDKAEEDEEEEERSRDKLNKKEVLSSLLTKSWLLLHNACSMTALLYLDVLSVVLNEGGDNTSELESLLFFSSRLVEQDTVQGPVASLKLSCVHFILHSRSLHHISLLTSHPNPLISDMAFKHLGTCDWLPTSHYTSLLTQAKEASLNATELALHWSLPVDIDIVYEMCLDVLINKRIPQLQTQAVMILTKLHVHHGTLLPHLLHLSSSLNPYEVRAALPQCLRKCYEGISGEDRCSIASKSKIMLCLTTLLQDEDEDVRQCSSRAILNLIDHNLTDISPEVTIHLLIQYIEQQHNDWWYLELIKWIHKSQIQELVTSHYSNQYKSNGYASTSRTCSPEEDHPLFESDVINAYAEPLLIPLTIARSIERMKKEESEEREEMRKTEEKKREKEKKTEEEKKTREEEKKREEKDTIIRAFREMSSTLYAEVSNIKDREVLSPLDSSSKRSLQLYTQRYKARLIAQSMKRLSEVWGVRLEEDWKSLMAKT